MLFKVHSLMASGEKDFFDENPGARAIKEFNDCTSRQMFFVCLVADRDPDSPLRSLPEVKRRTKAAEVAGWPLEDGKRLDKNGRNLVAGKVESVEAAIIAYRNMQYDELKDMFDAVDTQVQEAIKVMRSDKEELCTIVKETRSKSNGDVTKETSFDGKTYIQMVRDAMKLGTGLPELKETRDKLAAMLPKTNTVLGDLVTYTSNDFTPEELGDTEQSTIDTFMAKKREE